MREAARVSYAVRHSAGHLSRCSRKLDRAILRLNSGANRSAKGNELKDMLAAEKLRSDHPNVVEVSQPAALPADVREHLGRQLQAAYAALITARPPLRLLDLIAQLDSALAGEGGISAADFRQALIEMLPSLRAFAMSLIPNATRADDLVQETLLKAWAKQEQFIPGSNLKAWLCTILRNQLYTEIRKRKREVEDADGVMAAQMTAPAGQEHAVDLQVIQREIANLPVAQREALLLVGAQGLTYEAAAEVMSCEVGTVKSRVSRARTALTQKLGMVSERALA